MTYLDQWKQENKWLLLSDHFLGHIKQKNDLHTFTGLCTEIDLIWDEIFHNQDMMEHYINRCDLQNILYTKYALNALKLRLKKLETSLMYKHEALMGNIKGIEQELISRARKYPMEQILENYGCQVKRNRCACPVHGGKNPSSFSIKDNSGFCHCGWHGDSIALYMELHKVDFKEAVRALQ
jgi:hypothetical protein